MEKVTLTAPDISCDHCVMAIKRTVTKLPGVASVEGNAGKKQVTVTFDAGKTSQAIIEKAMEEEGYPVAR